MIGIYKITSPSNRIYIGQTKDLDERWTRYEKYDCRGQRRLYSSLLKYKVETHIFEFIEICGEQDLNLRERYWQDYYEVLSRKGLNCKLTATNIQPTIFSLETRLKISRAVKGKKRTDETRLQMSLDRKGRKATSMVKQNMSKAMTGSGNNFFGRIHTEESRLKISNIRKEREIPSWNCTLVLNLETGIFYNTIKEAANSINMELGLLSSRLSGKTINNTSFIKI